MTETITGSTINIWLYIAIIEFVTIIVLFILFMNEKNKHSETKKLKQKLKGRNEIDLQDTLVNIGNMDKAIELYNELKKKCHPDRFVGDDLKTEMADKLFQEITKNKNNYKKLEELKKQAIKELNISIN